MYTSIGAARARNWNAAIWRMALWGTFLALTFAGVVADAITLTAVQSRKAHGASTYDLTIDKSQSIGGAVTVESRAIGAGHQIVFQFDTAISPGSPGTATAVDEKGDPVGAAMASASGNDVVVTLTGVPDNKRVTVSLANVNGVGANVSASLGFLVGNASGSRTVSPTDLQQLKARSGQVVDAGNFKLDLNATGAITAADVSAVKGRLNRTLPEATSTVLPPDPASVAPPPDPTVVTTVPDSTAFLYTGTNPIQTGVSPGTIIVERAAVVRGKVLDKSGAALPGVTITVLNHPEFGRTSSRADGMFDMAVNGGGQLTFDYAKTGFLPAQRQVNAAPQNYTTLRDVMLLALDPAVTVVDLTGGAPLQAARGSTSSDADGPRRATLLIPTGTQAMLVASDGSTQPINSLSIRATEYTVGPDGWKAMPGELPPSSGYTYAVELSADEAIAAGAKEVRFSAPVPFYLENFLGFPVGSLVPTGYYDRVKGLWVASNNGRVIKVLGVNAGLADLDLDGSNVAASAPALATLGITDVERQKLATLYTPGQSLWRVLLAHLTPWDCNWPYGPPPGAGPPGGGPGGSPNPGPKPGNGPKGGPCKQDGSIIDCEPQTLGQALPVTGSALRLHYQSDRVPGRRSTHELDVQLSGATLPPGVQRIYLEVGVAGRVIKRDYPPAANLSDLVDWDGKDGYGRIVQGRQSVNVRIGYGYIPQYYATPDTFAASWNSFGAAPINASRVGSGTVPFASVPMRTEAPLLVLWQEYRATVGSLDVNGRALGGWSFSAHHAYDVNSRALELGTGGRRESSLMRETIRTLNTGTAVMNAMAAAPDGSVYVAYPLVNIVRRIAANGTTTLVAGTGTPCGHPTLACGDGGPATSAQLYGPQGLALAADGTLYIADANDGRIRRVGTNGVITTIAGNGTLDFSGDGGPATQAGMLRPNRLAIAPDGALYVSAYDQNASAANRVRRIGPDGIITTVAGSGVYCPPVPVTPCGDGGPATLAGVGYVFGIAIAPDGALYIADNRLRRVRRVANDGTITTVAGNGSACAMEPCGDGGPGTLAQISQPQDVAVGRDGKVYILDSANQRIRLLDQGGIISPLAGNGQLSGELGDGGFATAATLVSPIALAIGANGLLLTHCPGAECRVREIAPAFPGLRLGELPIASADGRELYIFTGSGRHLRTIDTLTGMLRLQFNYDGANRLTSVVDSYGNTTTIERNGSGQPTAIIAPFGQRSTLTLQSDGYLASVANPAAEATHFTYASGNATGLMTTLTDPRGKIHQFLYDAAGRLIRDEDPAGGVKILARTDFAVGHYKVTITTAAGAVTSYEVEDQASGDTRRLRTDPAGAQTETLLHPDGSRQVTYPDGTVAILVDGPDPRFGMQSPIPKYVTVAKPGVPTTTRSMTRTVTLATPSNPLSLTTQTEAFTVDGQTYTSAFSAATNRVTTTTPTGRQSVITVDAMGRIVSEQGDATFGLAPLLYTYDAFGRLANVSQGGQSWTYARDAKGRISARTDAAGSSNAYAYDVADRVIQSTLPGGRIYTFGYDTAGNRTQVTQPSRGIHLLEYTPIDQEAGYTPPGNNPYLSTHDADGRISLVTLPGGRTETFAYDSGSRSLGIVYPEATVALSYSAGDHSGRISSYTRTPAGPGPAQTIQVNYGGDLVLGANWTGAAAGQFTYTYDGRFKLKSMALASGADNVSTTLTRDNDGLLTALGPFNIARTGPAGAPSQIADGTLTVVQGYDTMGRVASRTNTVGGQQKFAVQVTYGNTGRIITKVETISGSARTYDYTYDEDGHLTQVQRDGTIVERYTYDADRNRMSRRIGNSQEETAIYDGQGRLIQQGSTTWQFNADGYLTQRGSDTFQYSTTGELLQAIIGGQTVTYAYDSLRRRVSRTVAGATTQYLYGNPENALQITHTKNSLGTLTTYYYDEGRRLFALQRGAARYYVGTDQLGSPRVVADAAGVVMKTTDYDAFGQLSADSNPAFDLVVGFAGGIADSDTGMVRFGLRDYDPGAGRWTARDPALFGSGQANLYAYVNNNPVNLIDPTGFGSGGVGLCDGVCVGLKLAWTDEGISACVEGGLGVGNSIDVDPMGDLDKGGLSLEAKASLKVGLGKVEYGVEVTDDPCGAPVISPKAEACAGPFCMNTDKDSKFSNDLSEDLKVKNPLKGEGGFGKEAKVVAKFCQQAKW